MKLDFADLDANSSKKKLKVAFGGSQAVLAAHTPYPLSHSLF
jgi:hypothetical protein